MSFCTLVPFLDTATWMLVDVLQFGLFIRCVCVKGLPNISLLQAAS